MKQQCLSDYFIVINDNPRKVHSCFLCVKEKEGKRANYRRDRVRECVRGRASVGREVASVQRSGHLHKHITEMQHDKQDEWC